MSRKHPKKRSRKHPKTRKVIVVGKIYAEWCHFCKELAPHWKHMKTVVSHKKYKFIQIEQSEMDVEIPKVNHTYLAHSNKKLELQGGFPTIFKIVGGQLSYYNGTPEGVLEWATGTSAHTKSKRIVGHGVDSVFGNGSIPFVGGSRKGSLTRKVSRKGSRKRSKSILSWMGLV